MVAWRTHGTHQRGTKIHPGNGVGKGGDDTLFATRTGVVDYRESRGRRYATVTAAQV
ncbi:MAG: hypothetical protein E6G63_02235 [Actinobacteria bacterium]|nr:MAG: hypothetical protein E6G63_02235 [Actinomycetota bacterium]